MNAMRVNIATTLPALPSTTVLSKHTAETRGSMYIPILQTAADAIILATLITSVARAIAILILVLQTPLFATVFMSIPM